MKANINECDIGAKCGESVGNKDTANNNNESKHNDFHDKHLNKVDLEVTSRISDKFKMSDNKSDIVDNTISGSSFDNVGDYDHNKSHQEQQEQNRSSMTIKSQIMSSSKKHYSSSSGKDLQKEKSEKRWENMFQRLMGFREKEGHCLVPNRYNKDPQLGAWVATQRRFYKMKYSETGQVLLSDEREKRLAEVGFAWTADNARCVPWNTRFVELLEFVVKNGHAQVPIGWTENVQLSNWVSTQRQEYKAINKGKKKSGTLNLERIKLLSSIGFAWKCRRGGTRRELKEGGRVVLLPKNRIQDAASSSPAKLAASTDYRATATCLLRVFRRGGAKQEDGVTNVVNRYISSSNGVGKEKDNNNNSLINKDKAATTPRTLLHSTANVFPYVLGTKPKEMSTNAMLENILSKQGKNHEIQGVEEKHAVLPFQQKAFSSQQQLVSQLQNKISSALSSRASAYNYNAMPMGYMMGTTTTPTTTVPSPAIVGSSNASLRHHLATIGVGGTSTATPVMPIQQLLQLKMNNSKGIPLSSSSSLHPNLLKDNSMMVLSDNISQSSSRMSSSSNHHHQLLHHLALSQQQQQQQQRLMKQYSSTTALLKHTFPML